MLKNSVRIPFLVFCLCSCKAPLYQMKFQDKAVKADGNPAEWKIPLRFYDSQSKLSYTVSNDLENLYICMRITDDAGQMKVMRAGMQVWIDTSGKNNEDVGILFPQRSHDPGPDNSGGPPSAARSGGHGTGRSADLKANNGAVRSKFLRDYKEMMLTGFHSPIRGSVPLENDFGIKLGINWDANKFDSSYIMVYEAVIPFSTFYKNRLSLSDSTKRFGISFVVNALPAPKPGGGAPSGGGMHGGGGGLSGGGMRGGGMGGGGMGGGGGHRGGGGQRGGGGGAPANPLYQTNRIKMRLQLAVKPEPPSKIDLFNQ